LFRLLSKEKNKYGNKIHEIEWTIEWMYIIDILESLSDSITMTIKILAYDTRRKITLNNILYRVWKSLCTHPFIPSYLLQSSTSTARYMRLITIEKNWGREKKKS